jgi:hypothetical protein
MDNKLILRALKRIGITEFIPVGGDWIQYLILDQPERPSLLVPLVGMIPIIGSVAWLWDLLSSDKEPSPDDIDRLEGRGGGRGRSSRRRGRAATDGGQVVTGGDRNDDDDGSGIPSGIIRVFGVLLGLGALLVVGVVGVSGTAGDYGQVAAEEVQDETVGGIAPDISEDVTANVQRGVGAAAVLAQDLVVSRSGSLRMRRRSSRTRRTQPRALT